MSKLSIILEFWDFLLVRKKWWLAPIIIFFALAYMACDWFEHNDKDNNTSMFAYNAVKNDTPCRKIINKIYVSISTLTTLGYGDMYPRHPISQTLVAIQTFITFMLVSDLAMH